MADSENTRTLSPITDRNLLFTAERFLTERAIEERTDVAGDIDPVLAKWNTWLAAHHEFARLCRVQQRLESKLMHEIDSPLVRIRLPGRDDPIIAVTEDEIEVILREEKFAEMRANAIKELSAKRRKWDAADEVIGYSRAMKAEKAASDLEAALVEELWNAPARSAIGTAAKLHAILRQGAPEPNTDDFPWPQIRSILTDLLGLGTRAATF